MDRMSFVRRREDRDLKRLALLERLSGPENGRESVPAPEDLGVRRIARYARFRHVAAFILALALCAAAVGAVGAALEAVVMLRGEGARLAALARVLAWVFAALAAYGLLKGVGEALLLLADAAELANSMHERSTRAPADSAR
ncbi:MAG: hypothetical protein BWX69_00076 [Planctomycetes bacterium ADurb.Bin069]|nr:MAG: hypothetical protein BWX69_00076 [Planctomycetes bacterium ADurb.Bin069]